MGMFHRTRAHRDHQDLLIITGAKSQYMMDGRGMTAPQAQRAAPQYGARNPSAQPQQYQQPRRRDDDIDSVR